MSAAQCEVVLQGDHGGAPGPVGEGQVQDSERDRWKDLVDDVRHALAKGNRQGVKEFRTRTGKEHPVWPCHAMQHWTVPKVPIEIAKFGFAEWAKGAAVIALRHQLDLAIRSEA